MAGKANDRAEPHRQGKGRQGARACEGFTSALARRPAPGQAQAAFAGPASQQTPTGPTLPRGGRETGIRAPGRPQRSEGHQGLKATCALSISRQLLAELLNRDPRILLLLQGGIDRIDPLQALLNRGEHLLLQQGDFLFPIGELNPGAAQGPAGGSLQDPLHAAEGGLQQQERILLRRAEGGWSGRDNHG